ncbi:MAG TPA: hypothetical protein VHN98_06890 [Acidimicrobiales bacterium]|nr:hypothetical protein [Acidimicrobiales bacterium]
MRIRLLAVLGAVLMIVAAVVVRARIDSSGDGGSNGGSGSSGNGTVVCDAALGDACPSSATREAATDTADRLLAVRGAAPLATWLTAGPWASMVDATRKVQSQSSLFGREAAVASTPLVAVVRKGRLSCRPVTWKCIGDASMTQPAIAVAAPDARTSIGLLVRVAAVSGFLGAPPDSIADVRDNADATTWLGTLEDRINDARNRGSTDLDTWISIFPASSDVFLTTQAEANAVVRGSRVGSDVDIVVPSPQVYVEAGVADTGSRRFDSTKLRELLTKAGWDPGAAKVDTGLPSPDVLLALQQVVR